MVGVGSHFEHRGLACSKILSLVSMLHDWPAVGSLLHLASSYRGLVTRSSHRQSDVRPAANRGTNTATDNSSGNHPKTATARNTKSNPAFPSVYLLGFFRCLFAWWMRTEFLQSPLKTKAEKYPPKEMGNPAPRPRGHLPRGRCSGRWSLIT